MREFLKHEAKRFREFLRRVYFSQKANKKIIDIFHKFYYDSGIHRKTYWFGVPVWKIPFDLWIYQEIIYELKPELIIETGTAYGGSALYMANILYLIGQGKVITIDIDDTRKRPKHPRITYLKGSSVSKEILDIVKNEYKKTKGNVIVILDSDHKKEYVLKELELYNSFVSKGSYLIVEDTNINGNPVYEEYGHGPMEAVKEFLKKNKNFQIDKTREKFFVSFNPNGYLKRIK